MHFKNYLRQYQRARPWVHTAHGVVLALVVVALFKFLLSPAPTRPEAHKTGKATPKLQSQESPSEKPLPESDDDPKVDKVAARQFEVIKQILMQEAAEREQQVEKADEFRRFQEQAAKGRACPGCQGAKTYRYVDARGQLVFNTCPYCNGTGKR